VKKHQKNYSDAKNFFQGKHLEECRAIADNCGGAPLVCAAQDA